MLKAGRSDAKFALFHNLDTASVCRKFAADIFGGEFTIEDFSFLTYDIRSKWIDRKLLPTVFDKMLSLYDGMEKVNQHFFMTDAIPYARDVSKRSVVSVLAEAAAILGEDKYFACLDARYDSFREEAQATYLQTAKDRTKLDSRALPSAF